MKNRDYENEEDWAREIPQRRYHGPHGDYGWERGQSVLSEFRDPDFHFSPEERERLERWQRQGTAWLRPFGCLSPSESESAPRDSKAQGMSSWGQGERGAKGYEDHGDSEIHPGH